MEKLKKLRVNEPNNRKIEIKLKMREKEKKNLNYKMN